jgi:hypothetical protein
VKAAAALCALLLAAQPAESPDSRCRPVRSQAPLAVLTGSEAVVAAGLRLSHGAAAAEGGGVLWLSRPDAPLTLVEFDSLALPRQETGRWTLLAIEPDPTRWLDCWAAGELAVCDLSRPGALEPGWARPDGLLTSDDFFYWLVMYRSCY